MDDTLTRWYLLLRLGVAFAFLAAPAVQPMESRAAETVIRTGGPSSPAESKVAIVASDRRLAGSPFLVRATSGRVVLRGRLRPASGFHRPWRAAFQADLSRIRKPGRYVVSVAGRRSRPWLVRNGGSAFLIDKLLDYLRTNRDGAEAALLHDPSHLNDGLLPGRGRLDLTGGWMDAGDMIHFTQTTGLLSQQLQAAARMAPGQAEALNREADVGLRWLLKAHPAGSDVFVAQVGDERDHRLGFRDPAEDDRSPLPGIGTRRLYTGVGGDVAGKVASALALAADRGSVVAPSSVLIDLAREWYEAGRAAAAPLKRLPGPSGGFYLSGTWRDDMAGGAAALYRSTGEPRFLEQALGYLARSGGVNGIGWIDNATFAAADICGALGAPPLGTKYQRRPACARLADSARDANRNRRGDAFGMAGYMTWGTTAENAAFGASAALAARAGRAPGSGITATGAKDWMFGRNPWGSSFVAGFGPNSPRKLHHWASVFGDGLPDGAVVGGPAPRRDILAENLRPRSKPFARFSTDRAAYEDLRVNYVTSEPAIDYNGTSILMLAALSGRHR